MTRLFSLAAMPWALILAMGADLAQAAAPDWSKVPARKITLFYPGQASLEWVMNKADHSAVPDIVDKKRSCAKCHEGDVADVGAAIVAGKPVGSSKTVFEATPVAGKAGSIPVQFQAAHDGNHIWFRFEWAAPPHADKPADSKNEVKLTLMFDGGGTVDQANLNGCWNTCHNDLRSMKNQKDDKKTKYIKNADLGAGRFMDLLQFRSGKGEKPVDGYVADARVMEGGKSLVKAEGRKDGNKWVVVFERELAAKGTGDHAITPDKIYSFGFAIHEDYAGARYHHVSLGYQFGLDKAVPEVKNYINVTRQ